MMSIKPSLMLARAFFGFLTPGIMPVLIHRLLVKGVPGPCPPRLVRQGNAGEFPSRRARSSVLLGIATLFTGP